MAILSWMKKHGEPKVWWNLQFPPIKVLNCGEESDIKAT